jgi:hypothetical protein
MTANFKADFGEIYFRGYVPSVHLVGRKAKAIREEAFLWERLLMET